MRIDVQSGARPKMMAAVAIVMTMANPAVTAQELSEPVLLAMPPSAKGLGRIDNKPRGRADALPEVITMTPAAAALVASRTMTPQPTLYWYLSRDTKRAVNFALREHRSKTARPVFQCEIAGPVAQGVHRIALSEHGVSLNGGTDYSWFVRLQETADGERIASTSFIEVADQNSTAGLREELAAASLASRYQRYAREYWYQALTTIIALVESAPLSRDYRNRYVELLRYGHLDDVAQHVLATPSIVVSSCARPAR